MDTLLGKKIVSTMRFFIVLLILVLCGCIQRHNKTAATTGEQLFKENCGACHSKKSLAVMGHVLESVHTKAEVELLYNYLQGKRTLPTDTAFIPLTKGKQYHGIHFPDMTAKEVQLIVDYLN